MSTFLFASIPVVAHTSNPAPFAARLVERGHRVLWYAGAAFHDQIAALGAEPLPYVRALDFSGQEIDRAFPELAGRSGISAIRRAFADIFVGHAAERVADLQAVVADHDVDAILCDGLMYGVGLTHELGGPVWATFGDGPLPYFDADTPPFGPALLPMRGPVGRLRNKIIGIAGRALIFGEAQDNYDRIRADLGLPRAPRTVLDESTSPYLHLQGCTPSFDYPRAQVPAQMHWVGALRPDPPHAGEQPDWWPEVAAGDRPVILVSQGSLRPDVTELLVPTVRGLAGEDVLVVVTTGAAAVNDLESAMGGELPANVRAARFVPYSLLLPHVQVFVTNGGYTGVTLALAEGVPMVQAGVTEEKSEIAARIHWAGVGIRLGTTRPTAGAVRAAVQRALTEPSFAAAARVIQQEMSVHDAGREGAELLERLARTQLPVLRPDVQPVHR